MSASVRAALPWLPPAGTVWQVEAGEHWDAVRVERRTGLVAIDRLDGQCGAVICDPWTRILYFLTVPGATADWSVESTRACSTSTYVSVPSLGAEGHTLHWECRPTRDLHLTDPGLLRLALEDAVAHTHRPRTEPTP
ncbi:hypothetical protein [Streptomyces sp. NPDC005407]|uniref:hypothetical protein n=1 Tax=Streptomyces sp. NPDC005407 TaxID=3155340 RepID=UPI0033BF559E